MSEKLGDITTNITVCEEGETDDAINPVLSTVVSPNGQVIEIHQQGVDAAMDYLDDIKELEIDPAVEKRLVRKIDAYLLPLMLLINAAMMMDKGTNSYASIMNLKPDLDMTDRQYSWVGSTLYFGYMVFNYPGTLILQKFPLSKMLSGAIFIWGVVLMCHAACTNTAGFLAARFFLGAFEGVMIPAYIMLTTQWYKKEEQFMRSCIYIGFQGLGSVMGAGIAYGLNKNWIGHSFAPWRMLYIITGIMTIFLAVCSYVHVPDIPTQAWFLTSEEKMLVVARIRNNQQGFGSHKIKKDQIIEAVKDLTVYMFLVYGFCYGCANGAFTNEGSIMMKEQFHFSTPNSLLMGMTGGLIDFIFAPLVALVATKFLHNQRLVACIFMNTICFIGMCLLNFTKERGSQLAGYLTFYLATGVLACMASLISSNVAGSSKKSTASFVFFVAYCVGNIVGPQTFTVAPYTGAKITLMVCFGVGTLSLCALYFTYLRRNRNLVAYTRSMGDKYEVPKNIEFADLTDKQNPMFRYSL